MSLNKMEWLRELTEEELSRVLWGDLSLVYSMCGIDTLIQLCDKLMGLNIYVSSKPLREAMKLYIRKKYDGTNRKELAIKLGVSERFVSEVVSNDRDKN